MRGRTPSGLVAAVALVVLAAPPAWAENPVLDPEDDAEIVEALAEATALHDVCYGYVLQVTDDDTGQFDGTYPVTNAGVGTAPGSAACTRGSVILNASLSYTSQLSESEDSSGWRVSSTLGGPSAADLEAQGLSAGDLTNDATSSTTLRNAVLALPALTAAQYGLPPLVLEPNTEPLPADARATGAPGNDWLRQNTGLLVLCGLLLVGGLVALAASFRTVRPAVHRAGSAHGDAPTRPDPWSPA